MYTKKIIYFLTIAFLLVGAVFIFFNNKEYIDGNVLNLPYKITDMTEGMRLTSPWVNNILSAHLMFRTLLLPDYTLFNNFKADLASSIDILEDGYLYKVNFIPGRKWSDGTDITLDDVIWSLETVSSVPRSNSYYSRVFDTIESIEAEGNTLNIRLKEQSAIFKPFLSQLAILPKHCLGDIAPEAHHDANFWRMPVTSGMFKVDHYEPEQYFKLVHNEFYSGIKPKIKEVYLYSDLTVNTKYDYYYTNDISVMMNFRAIRTYQEYIIDMLFYRYLVFNIGGSGDGYDYSAMVDIRTRQAICMALNREKLLHDIYLNAGNVVDGAGNINALGPYDYNPTKAKELLKESNYDLSRPLRFGYYYTDTTSKDFITAAAKQLEEIGFTVELHHIAGADALYKDRNYDVYLKGYGATNAMEWFQEYSPANLFFVSLFGGKGEFDELVSAISIETDSIKQEVLLKELVALEEELVYKFPLFTLGQSVYINTERLKLPTNFKNGNYFYIFDYGFADWEIKKQ